MAMDPVGCIKVDEVTAYYFCVQGLKALFDENPKKYFRQGREIVSIIITTILIVTTIIIITNIALYDGGQ